MPYIPEAQRSWLDDRVAAVVSQVKMLASDDDTKIDGIANYVISCIVRDLYLDRKPSYHRLARASNVFHKAGQEFDRRVLAKYEDKASKKNGDIYNGG